MKYIVLVFLMLFVPVMAYAGTVVLGWTGSPASDGVTSYKVCYSNISGNNRTFSTANCQSIAYPTVSATVTSLDVSQNYYFRVQSVAPTQTSLWSNFAYAHFIQGPTTTTIITISP